MDLGAALVNEAIDVSELHQYLVVFQVIPVVYVYVNMRDLVLLRHLVEVHVHLLQAYEFQHVPEGSDSLKEFYPPNLIVMVIVKILSMSPEAPPIHCPFPKQLPLK